MNQSIDRNMHRSIIWSITLFNFMDVNDELVYVYLMQYVSESCTTHRILLYKLSGSVSSGAVHSE